MLSGVATANISQVEAAFNTDLRDQQNPLQTENGLEEKICMRANKIEFHNEDSGFKLEAKCIGKGSWKVTLVNDVVIGDTIVLNFTITHEGNDIFDSAILFGSDDVLAKRELKLETVDKDRIDIEFKRDKKNKWF